MNNWNILQTDANLALMSQVLGIREITAQVMANRGIRSKNTALSYLYPSAERMHDPLQMKGADAALEAINQAVDQGDPIMIYGDYDVDGIMGTVILHKALRRLNAQVDFYIPHRAEEGYGLNAQAVRHIASQGARLIIAVDNGVSAVCEIDEARRLGMQVVVIDHHEPGEALPNATVVDPKQADCPYPYKSLCAAGLAYKMCAALFAARNEPFDLQDELLALAAIATLCDMVELTDENRILVKLGLAVLNDNKLINPGLGTLITRRGYLDKPIDVFVVGYILGPCINAVGRLEHAKTAVQLLLATTDEQAVRYSLAERLCALNEERKALTQNASERMLNIIKSNALTDKILVMADKDMHESVAGIVAGRVRDAVNRPCVVLTSGDSAMKGSGRSVDGFDLYAALYAHRHLFVRFGGHAMAAGLTLPEENIAALRQGLNADCRLADEDFAQAVDVDRVLEPQDITLALSDELARLAPFGKGNPEPLFVGYGLTIESARVIDDKNTLIFSLAVPGGKPLKGIAFGLNEKYNERYKSMDALFAIETNVYNGTVSVQIRIKDFSYAGD